MTRIVLRPLLGSCALLLIPLLMTVIDRDKPAGEGWRWDALDFVVMGALLFGAGVAYELLARRFPGRRARWLCAGAVGMLALAIWVELAVGGVSQLLHWLQLRLSA